MENIPLANWHAFASKANWVSYNECSIIIQWVQQIGWEETIAFCEKKKN